ncbi:hypothetical protein CK501_06130 [Halovibrio salipaludis]|uniref:Uncharacterized protein n=1 Tax=Halovibrio salipaludis TaxID=2032626 RepID=A0A2A2F977_9GAMM|nr:hypothetical protein [Halovibrio salipaludis]PAU81135.1 hypothetical protein CK501_06130 [Halovibrio salipaludis]
MRAVAGFIAPLLVAIAPISHSLEPQEKAYCKEHLQFASFAMKARQDGEPMQDLLEFTKQTKGEAYQWMRFIILDAFKIPQHTDLAMRFKTTFMFSDDQYTRCLSILRTRPRIG